MSVFKEISTHEQVVFCNHEESGLKAIIAIHDTTLGPALGGCRMWPYESEEEALRDALRLAKGMTYKCAAADVDFGGGKAVIIGDPNKDKSPELFRAFGRFVESLNGRFYTGTDMGTTTEDFVFASRESNCIVGLPEEHGGSGDSSIPTALGVLQGIRATAQYLWGTDSIKGRKFAVQGLGKVGKKLVRLLWEEGASVIATDIHPQSLEELKQEAEQAKYPFHAVKPEDIYDADADMFVPCAMGGVVNDDTISRLKCQAVVGSANNQLLHEKHGSMLDERGILFAPDYVVNSGGLIQVADELYGSNKERVMKKTRAIYDMVYSIYQYAAQNGIKTVEAADRLVEERIRRAKEINSMFVRNHAPKWNVRRG